MRLVRLSLIALALLAISVAPLSAQAPEVIAPLHFSGEPIGYEATLFYDLEADARALLAREPQLADATSLDPTAAAFQRGERIRAFAEALAVEKSPDDDLLARAHVRRAWILAELGAANFGAKHANEALTSTAALGELHLARAWLLWRAGNFADADREAGLAATATPAAPAWALAAWKKFRADPSGAIMAFAELPQPENSTTPDFLAYANAARAAGALSISDEAYARAQNLLQQQYHALPETSPDRLIRVSLESRDSLLAVLGAPSPATVGPRLWSTAVFSARSPALLTTDRAVWEKYFSLLHVAQTAVPGFDFTEFDLASDLALAEATVKLAPAWRDRFAALLARPDLRYPWRELQAERRLEEHPAFQFQYRDLEDAFKPDELAQLQEFVKLHATEIAALKDLRAQLPADTAPGTRELFFTRIGLTQSLRLAVAEQDFNRANDLLADLQAVRTADDQPVREASDLGRALTRVLHQRFYADVAEFASVPAVLLDEDDAFQLHLRAAHFSQELEQRVGDNYDNRFGLAPEYLLLVHYLTHVRFIDALVDGEILIICDRFNDLEVRVTRDDVPAYPLLEKARAVLQQIPADSMESTPAESALLENLRSDRDVTADTLKQAQAFYDDAPDKLLTPLLVALTHWRLGHEDEAMAIITKLRQRARAHPPTLDQLTQIEGNNSTKLIMEGHLAKIAEATPATRDEIFKSATFDGNLMANRLIDAHGGEKFDPLKLPPLASEGYAYAVAVVGLTRLTEGELMFPTFALNLVRKQNRPALVARLEAAFPAARFTHDLPNADAIAAWRDLLQTAPLDDATATALAQRATSFENDSVSIRVAATAIALRRAAWQDSLNFVAVLRQHFGTNRALARQLDVLDTCINDCLALDRTTAAAERTQRRQARLAQLFRELNSLATL